VKLLKRVPVPLRERFNQRLTFPIHRRVPFERFAKILSLPNHLRRKKLGEGLVRGANGAPAVPEDRGYLVWKEGSRLSAVQAALSHAKRRISEVDLGNLRHYLPHRDRYLKEIPLSDDKAVPPEYLALATDPAIMAIVCRYYGFLPSLNLIQILYSPNKERIEDHSTQLFHIDTRGYRMLRLHIPIETISETAGPIHILPIDKSRRLVANYRGGYWPDERVFELAKKEDVVSLTAEPGTVILFDSCRCMHFGARPGDRPRFSIHLQYRSPYTVLPCDIDFLREYPKTPVSMDEELQRLLFSMET
jgi:hypothetical protein